MDDFKNPPFAEPALPFAAGLTTPTEYVVELARSVVANDFVVEAIQRPRNPARDPLILRGRLLRPSHEVFPRWREAFQRRGYTPLLHPADVEGQVELQVVPGVIRPQPSNPWINLGLFVVTVLSTLFVGALYSPNMDLDPRIGLWGLVVAIFTTPEYLASGVPFAATLLGILTAHEFGHYFAARYHKVAVTLPYFIPMPLGFGTLGAFIRLKEPVPDRRKLFDIGVAGPLAGLVLALPLLFYGLATSEVRVPDPVPGAVLEGNSILYYFAKILIHGQPLPNPATGVDVLLNDVAFAAWIGLLVTALNLLPLGQLDGGHTVFALFGKGARIINGVVMAAMFVLAIAGLPPVQAVIPALANVGWTGWFIWLILINVLGGPFHPPALDDVTTLDPPRRWVGYLVVFLFIITFVPVPLRPL